MARKEQRAPYFLWVDLEMTGLIPEQERIIEIAAIVTDYHLEPQATFHEVIHQPQEFIDNMDDWNKKTHGKTGLIDKIPHGKPIEQVEQEFLYFLNQFYEANEAIILCGNSISQDKAFIKLYMERLDQRLHYRIIDISSIKEIFQRIYDQKFDKRESHKAVEDIEDSINELKYYMSFINLPMLPSGKTSAQL
jgi:oligoribonuclease